MATFPTRLTFTANNQSLSLYVAGQAYVGIGLSGTWAGVVSFSGSIDGANFFPLTCQTYPYVEGAAGVQGFTQVASGVVSQSLVAPVQNLTVVKVKITTFTSGSPQVALAASQDGSYQNAFVSQSGLWKTQASSSNGVNTFTIAAANSNHPWKVSRLIVSFNGTPTTAQVQIKDGATVLQTIDLPLAAGQNDLTTYLGGIAGSPGNALQAVVAAPGAGVVSDVNCLLEAA
jgi:hypothetical protein